MNELIEIKNLSTYYDNVCALYNINLKIKKNDFLTISGPNGGGKTTLIKNILGLFPPTKGTIKILGKNINESKNKIGYVPQFSKFDNNFPINVLDTVLCGTITNRPKLFHKYTNKDKDLVYDILSKLNLYNLKNRQIGNLSGGQLQRVLIARALCVNPKILILDEPTASLDVNSKLEIYSILKELNKTKTILIVSHDISLIEKYSTSVAYISKTLKYYGKFQLSNSPMKELTNSLKAEGVIL